jgi:hypothetical protein
MFFGWFVGERSLRNNQMDFVLFQLLLWSLLSRCPAAIVPRNDDALLFAALERAAPIVKPPEEFGGDGNDNASIFCQNV